MGIIDKILNKIAAIILLIMIGLFLGVMFCAGIDVFNRMAVGASLAWAQRMAVWMNIAVIFLVAPIMVLEETHIKVVFLFDKLKGLMRTIVDRLNRIALIVFSFLALWGGLAYVIYLKSREVSRVLGLWWFPYWIIALFLPIGMGLIVIFAVYVFFTKFRKQGEK